MKGMVFKHVVSDALRRMRLAWRKQMRKPDENHCCERNFKRSYWHMELPRNKKIIKHANFGDDYIIKDTMSFGLKD